MTLQRRDCLLYTSNTGDEKVIALIEVKVTPQRGMGFDKIAERIYQYSEVTSVYLMSGAFDFTVIIEGKTMREVAQFVSEKLSPMDSVLSTATHFVLKKYKDHGTVMCGKAEDERMMITPVSYTHLEVAALQRCDPAEGRGGHGGGLLQQRTVPGNHETAGKEICAAVGNFYESGGIFCEERTDRDQSQQAGKV